jgi:hypothetical protein
LRPPALCMAELCVSKLDRVGRPPPRAVTSLRERVPRATPFVVDGNCVVFSVRVFYCDVFVFAVFVPASQPPWLVGEPATRPLSASHSPIPLSPLFHHHASCCCCCPLRPGPVGRWRRCPPSRRWDASRGRGGGAPFCCPRGGRGVDRCRGAGVEGTPVPGRCRPPRRGRGCAEPQRMGSSHKQAHTQSLGWARAVEICVAGVDHQGDVTPACRVVSTSLSHPFGVCVVCPPAFLSCVCVRCCTSNAVARGRMTCWATTAD